MKAGYLFCVLAVMMIGCNPDKGTSIGGGGKGGSVAIRVTPTYQNSFVDTCMVYIRYGTQDAPANGVYDDSVVCTVVNDTPYAVFTGLTTGQYYFSGVGYHGGSDHSPYVRGGKKYSVSKEGTTGLYLPTYSYTP